MKSKPVVAILVDRTCQANVISPKIRQQLDETFDVRWPSHDGKVTPEDAKIMLRDAEGSLTSWGSPSLSAEVLAAAPKLKIAAHGAGSVKGYITDAVYDRGVIVTSAAYQLAIDVAHYALGLMIIGRKNLFPLSAAAAKGHWWDKPKEIRGSESIRNSTIGIVSASHVGRSVLKLLQPFDVTCLVYDPFITAEKARELGAEKVELLDLCKRSEIVSLHAPSIPATNHMIGAKQFEAMQDGALLVNTARGSILDEAALLPHLKSGKLFAFLDVTDPEPPIEGSPLYGAPNLVLSPHIAGSTGKVRQRVGQAAAEELFRYFAGEKPQNVVTKEMLATIA